MIKKFQPKKIDEAEKNSDKSITNQTNDNVIKVVDLSFAINDTLILKNISLEVKKGEFIGLIGPNGAGKTTLLKCLNGINKATGDIFIKGRSIADMSCREIARDIALMHQNTSVTFSFPVIDIVMAGRYPHISRFGMETQEDYRIARKYIEYTNTLEFENKHINKLSGGERQRVLFAKALAQETEIILLDEPTASLDIAHEEQIFKYSRELVDEGRTVIAAVHDLKIAAHYCSRLVLLKEGKVIADGSPENVLTASNLSQAYGVNALVYRNKITGQLDFYLHGMEYKTHGRKAHVIGGGGSAAAVIRQLFEAGYKVTAGVFAHGDSDIQCAQIFGIEYLSCPPFSEISEQCHQENISMIESADAVVLCNMPFGFQNMKNLEAAKIAKNLIILEDEPPHARDFTGGKAVELYKKLKETALTVTSATLHEVL